jgi:hypothetical protein
MNNTERLYLIKAAGSTQPTAQDYGNAANMAAQPLLNVGASLYNNFAPQGVKDFAAGKARNIVYGGGFNNDVSKMDIGDYGDKVMETGPVGFNQDKSQGELVSAQTTSATSGTQNFFDDRTSNTMPGTAQNPFRQIMGSMINNKGNIPTRTFNTGANVYQNQQTANGEMGKTTLLPGNQSMQQAHDGVTNSFMAQNPIKPPQTGA